MGSVQMHIADMVTSVMPELKLIHMQDSDLDHFMLEEFRHDFHLALLRVLAALSFPSSLWKTGS